MFSRSRLKLALVVCLATFGATSILLYQGRPRSHFAEEMIFFVEGGSAVGALAISIALIATL